MALPLVYNWRNLFVRKTTTVLTCLIIASVVAVFSWLLGFMWALHDSLSFADDRAKIIALKLGATSETNSAIPPEDYNKLSQLTGLATDPTGEPLKSPEMVVQVSLPRLGDQSRTNANVAVRGVTDTAFLVHTNVAMLEGRRFAQGQYEVIAGAQAAKQFGGLKIGDTLKLGYGNNREFTVVGHFTANGAPVESEIWGPETVLMSMYRRTAHSSVALRLRDAADADRAVADIQGPAIEMTAKTEPDYWASQTENIVTYMFIVGGLVGIMSVAAVFAIANTMYAAVAGRTREIAMLRTIGFTGRQVLVSLIYEAVLISLMGGAMGVAACAVYLAIAGGTKDMFGANTFTTMGFEIKLTPSIVVLGLAMVAAVGAVGAFFPAYRASKMQVIRAMREA